MSFLKKLKKRFKPKRKTAPFGGKVNLFVVGEQKCGTTSLHTLLVKSPLICEGTRKEMHFFDRELGDVNDYEAAFQYEAGGPRPFYAIDSSPNYAWVEGGIESIHAYNPDAKIIYLTRNPIDRFFSTYRFYRQNVDPNRKVFQETSRGRKMAQFIKANPNMPLEKFIEAEKSTDPIFFALERGKYDVMKRTIEAHFPANQIYYSSLEMLSNPDSSASELKRLADFLELGLGEASLPHSNVTRKDHATDQEIMAFLQDYYS
ncbi:MAG: sulfotransferase family protein [Luteolibacter sp.]